MGIRHSSTGNTMWLTLAVSVTASCKKFTWQTQQMHYEGVLKGQLQIPSNMIVHNRKNPKWHNKVTRVTQC